MLHRVHYISDVSQNKLLPQPVAGTWPPRHTHMHVQSLSRPQPCASCQLPAGAGTFCQKQPNQHQLPQASFIVACRRCRLAAARHVAPEQQQLPGVTIQPKVAEAHPGVEGAVAHGAAPRGRQRSILAHQVHCLGKLVAVAVGRIAAAPAAARRRDARGNQQRL